MALTDKAYERIHNKTGSDKAKLKTVYDEGFLDININDPEGANPFITSLVHQIGLIQDELDYLRTTAISNNSLKVTFPGFGTSSGTALEGDTTLLQLGTSSTTALAGDTKLVSIGPKTTLSFGDMVATTVKGKTTYTIALSVTTDFGGKTGSVTKSVTLTLT